MRIQVEVVNRTQVVASLKRVPVRVAMSLREAIAAATIDLANYIKAEKLSGQVLNVRTGTLRRAVRAFPPVSSADLTGTVAVDRSASVYGRAHEFGGRGSYEIRPIRAQVLAFMVGGEVVFARSVTHPPAKERSFMRSGLADRREAITQRLQIAVGRGLDRKG